jgi:hypothetical protein
VDANKAPYHENPIAWIAEVLKYLMRRGRFDMTPAEFLMRERDKREVFDSILRLVPSNVEAPLDELPDEIRTQLERAGIDARDVLDSYSIVVQQIDWAKDSYARMTSAPLPVIAWDVILLPRRVISRLRSQCSDGTAHTRPPTAAVRPRVPQPLGANRRNPAITVDGLAGAIPGTERA